MAVMVRAFVIMENPKAAHEVQQLVVLETEFSPARMLVTEMIVDEKGFVDQDATGPQCLQQHRKERPIKVAKSEYDLVAGSRDLRRPSRIFKVHRVGGDRCQTVLRGVGGQIRQRLLVPVDRINRKTLRGKVERVSASPAGDIEGMSTWEYRERVFQELCRGMIKERGRPGAVEFNTDGPLHAVHRRDDLPNPQLGSDNREFVKQHGCHCFAQRLQQDIGLLAADFQDPRGHCSVVDRIDNVRGRDGQGEGAGRILEFQINGNGLKRLALDGGDTAMPLEFKAFNHQVVGHAALSLMGRSSVKKDRLA
jgi:hypothetical protein